MKIKVIFQKLMLSMILLITAESVYALHNQSHRVIWYQSFTFTPVIYKGQVAEWFDNITDACKVTFANHRINFPDDCGVRTEIDTENKRCLIYSYWNCTSTQNPYNGTLIGQHECVPGEKPVLDWVYDGDGHKQFVAWQCRKINTKPPVKNLGSPAACPSAAIGNN